MNKEPRPTASPWCSDTAKQSGLNWRGKSLACPSRQSKKTGSWLFLFRDGASAVVEPIGKLGVCWKVWLKEAAA